MRLQPLGHLSDGWKQLLMKRAIAATAAFSAVFLLFNSMGEIVEPQLREHAQRLEPGKTGLMRKI